MVHHKKTKIVCFCIIKKKNKTQQINTMAKSGGKLQFKKKRGFRLREEQMFAALYRAVANQKTKTKTHPDTGCSKTLIQEKKTIYSRFSKMFI